MHKKDWRFLLDNGEGEFTREKGYPDFIKFLKPCLFRTKILGKNVVALGWKDQFGAQREFPLTVRLSQIYNSLAADPHNARIDFIGSWEEFLKIYAKCEIPFRVLSKNPEIVVTGKLSTFFLFEVINIADEKNRSCHPETFNPNPA